MRRFILVCVVVTIAIGCGSSTPPADNQEALKKEQKALDEARKKEGMMAK